MRALVAKQAALIKRQRERIAELEARRLTKNSHNSSKPSPRSQCKHGWQNGYSGTKRALVDEPDRPLCALGDFHVIGSLLE